MALIDPLPQEPACPHCGEHHASLDGVPWKALDDLLAAHKRANEALDALIDATLEFAGAPRTQRLIERTIEIAEAVSMTIREGDPCPIAAIGVATGAQIVFATCDEMLRGNVANQEALTGLKLGGPPG